MFFHWSLDKLLVVCVKESFEAYWLPIIYGAVEQFWALNKKAAHGKWLFFLANK